MSLLATPLPAQDYVIISAERSPGKVTVQQARKPSGWDERKGWGLTGATLVAIGDPLGTFALFFELWNADSYSAYKDFYGKYFAPSVKLVAGSAVPKALGITHPVLDALGIATFVVEDRSELSKDELGLWSQTIYCKEYRKPKPLLVNKPIAIPAASVAAPNAEDQADLELQAKFKQLAALAGP